MNLRATLPPMERLTEYCRANGIARLEIFGSALREDFGDESDIDLLVAFEPERTPDLFEFARMEEELSVLFGRKVDLVSRRAVEQSRNSFRRASVLGSARRIYAA